MKIIKAYVRTAVAKHVIKKLEENGVKNMMVEKNDEIARWDYRQAGIYSLEYLENNNVIEKIEFECESKDVELLREIIKLYSRSGDDDEGLIVVQPTEKISGFK